MILGLVDIYRRHLALELSGTLLLEIVFNTPGISLLAQISTRRVPPLLDESNVHNDSIHCVRCSSPSTLIEGDRRTRTETYMRVEDVVAAIHHLLVSIKKQRAMRVSTA